VCPISVRISPQILLFICLRVLLQPLSPLMLLIARYKLLYVDWRGYLVAFFALVWVANQYMSIYNRLRLDIKHEQVEITADEKKVDKIKASEQEADRRKAA
jgi:hypothetical protein